MWNVEVSGVLTIKYLDRQVPGFPAGGLSRYSTSIPTCFSSQLKSHALKIRINVPCSPKSISIEAPEETM